MGSCGGVTLLNISASNALKMFLNIILSVVCAVVIFDLNKSGGVGAVVKISASQS